MTPSEVVRRSRSLHYRDRVRSRLRGVLAGRGVLPVRAPEDGLLPTRHEMNLQDLKRKTRGDGWIVLLIAVFTLFAMIALGAHASNPADLRSIATPVCPK